MTEPRVRVRLQYLYPETDRSFFRARDFILTGDQIVRTGLFGDAPDVAGVVMASDSLHIQFNEEDAFHACATNRLRISCAGTAGEIPAIKIEELGGFSRAPDLSAGPDFLDIDFSAAQVGPQCFIRIRWIHGRTGL